MIKLILFAPCEKIITGQDNVTSLISVIEHIVVSGNSPEELAANTGLPFKWSATCLWYRAKQIAGTVAFEMKIDVIAPDEVPMMGGQLPFEVSNEHTHFRNQIDFPVFPIGQKGIYWLELSYKKRNSEVWEKVGRYPITVIHNITRSENEVENKVATKQPVQSV